jgi:hypothetical protein
VGRLKIPAGGLLYLDADSIIYRLERIAPYSALLSDVFNAARAFYTNDPVFHRVTGLYVQVSDEACASG